MYRKARVYICDICGCSKEGTLLTSDFDSWYILPRGWHGSDRRNGVCICRECYAAMEKVKESLQ